MLFYPPPETAHELISLRPIEVGDLDAWYSYLSLPMVYEHTSWAIESASELESFVWSSEALATPAQPRFAIVLRSINKLVGTAGFHTVSPQNKTAELAYDLYPSYWGKGIATRVCSSLLSWAHSHVGLVRVQATVLESNHRSSKVLQRCGFEHEGLLKSYRMVRGKPSNFHMYSHVLPTAA